MTRAHVCVADRASGLRSLWDVPERIPHIRLVREADVALVVPATANLLAKLAAGIADDLLTTALLAARIPRILAPAMNAAMYEDPATQANLSLLRAREYEIVDPERGFLAERESGIGRLGERGAHSRRAGARAGAPQVAARQARRDHRRPDARAVRSGALLEQRLDGRDRRSRSRAKRRCAARRSRCCSVRRCSSRRPGSTSCASRPRASSTMPRSRGFPAPIS